ncbi:MAG: 4Fe-4S binding protein [Candidatus Bathyarchaeota archaeon]|nr:4Fe-4S binding protein [Candidatus Bathyarchaeota archaeon]MCX8177426.1 4Fe-4S binding protein [Candidatus Bathyarchaeota archaeon]MDW8194441.1 4Fe-4S binding protein [Nitrososphaerota archaeon]
MRRRTCIITYYGYMDGSGEYYIVIDSSICDGCGLCVGQCPKKIIETAKAMIDIEEKIVATVKEEHRKNIKYECLPCKPDKETPPCVSVCKNNAIRIIWKAKA